MSKKRPKNMTLHGRVLAMARRTMRAIGEENLSAFVEDLIRNEYERRCGMIPVKPITPVRTAAASKAEAIARNEVEGVPESPKQ